MSTVSPAVTPVAVSRWNAVAPVSIRPAACSQLSPAGLGTSDWAETVISLA
jgi:hypothetical protein